MGIYKITNITGSGDKRQQGFNNAITITYINNMINNTAYIKPNEVLFIEISALPISVYKLKAKNQISVIEVSKREMNDYLAASKIKVAPIAVAEEVTDLRKARKIKPI